MVNMGLSAKQENDARFQQIKKEVDEMVKVRVPFMKSKVPFNFLFFSIFSLYELHCISKS